MNICKSKAIVLKSKDFRDSSRILTLFTQKFGKIKMLAKGVKSAKSRLAGNLQQFSVIEVVFYKREQSDLHFLSQADLLDPRPGLYQDLDRLSHASAAVELVNKMTAQEEPHPGLFSLLTEATEQIQSLPIEKLPLAVWSFALRLAANLGYRPNLAGCSICRRRSLNGSFVFFSVEQGGLLCRKCTQPGSLYLRLSLESWTLMKRMLGTTHSSLEKLEASPKQLQEVSDIVLGLLEYHAHTQKNLRSLEFLERLKA
jgi:DNA repair protein RecO (recombination protein O)